MPKGQEQVNISLTEQEQEYVRNNHGKISIKKMERETGISYTKLHTNIRIMGLRKPVVKDLDFETNGFFDIDKWRQIL